MGKMLYCLPPLAPDYSGVASVFHDLGALTVIHDASGCTGTYTGYDEPRWFGSASPVFCSGLREMDAIMGDDDKLLGKIEAALKDTDVPCIVIIGSPVPMIIGFDFAGFAALTEKQTGLPCLAFSATGLAYHDAGQKAAYLSIAERFLNGAEYPVNSGTVNILGASPLDGFDDEKLDALISLIQSGGLRAGAVWGMRSDLAVLRQTPASAVNWVVTAAALPLAEYLRWRFGTPFVAGMPLGAHETARIMSGLAAAAQDRTAVLDQFPPGEKMLTEAPAKALLIGEGLFCASLRVQMKIERSLTAVRIGSLLAESRAVFGGGDMFFDSEETLCRALAENDFELVAGDPLIRELLPPDFSAEFMAIPHRAVSSRLYG
jgi:nitrogenase molybdenum-iron protein alpha/beta subunit